MGDEDYSNRQCTELALWRHNSFKEILSYKLGNRECSLTDLDQIKVYITEACKWESSNGVTVWKCFYIFTQVFQQTALPATQTSAWLTQHTHGCKETEQRAAVAGIAHIVLNFKSLYFHVFIHFVQHLPTQPNRLILPNFFSIFPKILPNR